MTVPSSYLGLIDDLAPSHLELLRHWCGISSNTFDPRGLAKMADALVESFAPLGEVERIELPPFEQIDDAGNTIARPLGQALHWVHQPDAALRALLVIHYDTVYRPDDPFDRVRELPDGRWNGPGVIDAKGGIAVLLLAMKAWIAGPWASRIGWEIVLNPDEEIGSPGSASLLEAAARRNHLGLLFEPALPDGMLVGERMGSGNFTVVIRGRAAHAGRDFGAGRSAIVALADLIVESARQSDGLILNCGQISGGSAVNIVPDLAIARFNARISRRDEATRLAGILENLVARANQADGISATLHGTFSSPPKPLDDASRRLFEEARSCGHEIGVDLTWRSSGGTCDGNRLAAAGLPLIDTLGPVGGALHSPLEYLLPHTLAQRAKLTASLLARLANDPARLASLCTI
jgi:glutamate carboxypeptidase